MLAIEFPPFPFKMRREEGKDFILDIVRKRWVRLTPEEWVRQNLLAYITEVKHYPPTLLAIEKEIQLGEMKKRCDVVVYKNSLPWMIIECKQPDVFLSEKTLMQAIRYNMVNNCTYLVISNGKTTRGWRLENGDATEINSLPEW